MDFWATLFIAGIYPLILIVIFLFIIKQNKKIMSTQAELALGLQEVKAQVAKIGEETKATLAKVIALEEALANSGNVSPEVQAAFDELKAQVEVVDALVPDAPAETPAEETPTV
jgi:uncharacterized protein YoxC